jgi:hypothetical protein
MLEKSIKQSDLNYQDPDDPKVRERQARAKEQAMQRVTPGISELFQPVEDALARVLNTIAGITMSSARRAISALPCRKGGLGVADPVKTASANYDAAFDATKVLREAFMQDVEVDLKQHLAHVANAKQRAIKKQDKADESTVQNALPQLLIAEQLGFIMAHNENLTSFLSSNPKVTNQLIMTAEEYRDALALSSGYTPPHLPMQCRGCLKDNPDFRHLMQCRIGGANQARHNEYARVIANILELADFSPVAMEVPVPHPPGLPGLPAPEDDLKTDITARNIFEPQGTTHFDVKFIDSGGQYVYERMTTKEERERGCLVLTNVFPSVDPARELPNQNPPRNTDVGGPRGGAVRPKA